MNAKPCVRLQLGDEESTPTVTTFPSIGRLLSFFTEALNKESWQQRNYGTPEFDAEEN